MKKRSLTIRKFFNYALIASFALFTPQIASADIQSILDVAIENVGQFQRNTQSTLGNALLNFSSGVSSLSEKISGQITNSTQAMVRTSISLSGEISKNIGDVKELATDIVKTASKTVSETSSKTSTAVKNSFIDTNKKVTTQIVPAVQTTIAIVGNSVTVSSEKAVQLASSQSASVTSALNDGLEKVYGFAIDKTANVFTPFFVKKESSPSSSLTVQNFSTTSPKQKQSVAPSTATAQVPANRVLPTVSRSPVNDLLVQSIFKRLATLENRPVVAGPIQQYITNTYTGGASYSVPADTTSYTNSTVNSAVSTAVDSLQNLISVSATNTYAFILATSTTATSTFSGNVNVGGNMEVDGNITATNFFGDGSNLTGITSFSTSTTRSVFSNSVTGLTYDNGTGVTALTSGYNIPLTASTTEWSDNLATTASLTTTTNTLSASTTNLSLFWSTPSTRITAGTGLSWSGNTLNSTAIDSQWTTTGSDIYYTTGKVGIGTTAPVNLLDIVKSDGTNPVTLNVQNTIGNTSGIAQLMLGTRNTVGDTQVGAKVKAQRTDVGSAGTTDLSFSVSSGTTMTERMRILGSGNVGVGTTSPSAKFAITGTGGTGDLFRIASSTDASLVSVNYLGALTLPVGSANAPSVHFGNGGGVFSVGGSRVSLASGYSELLRADLTALLSFVPHTFYGNINIGSSADLSLSRNGAGVAEITNGTSGVWRDLIVRNLSMGTTSTSTTLMVQGVAGKDVVDFASSTGASLFRITQAGNVGIGTTTPTARLAITGTAGTTDLFNLASSTNASLFKIGSTGATYFNNDAGTIGMVLLSNGASASPTWVATSSLGISSGSSLTGTTGQIAYFSGTDTAVGTSTIFISSGNVGIGTTTPAELLTVAGNAQIFGSLKVASSTNGSVVIGDTSGNARGVNSLDIQSYRSAADKVASAANSVAIGISNAATYEGAVAIGIGNTAWNYPNATAIGNSNSAIQWSSAIGYGNTAQGQYNNALGYSNTTSWSAYYANAIGSSNTTLGSYSLAIGHGNTAGNGDYQGAAIGKSNLATGREAVSFGSYNFLGLTGNGSLAVGILNNQTGGSLDTLTGAISGTPAATSSALGKGATIVGILNTGLGNESNIFGFRNITGTSAASSTVLGYGNISSAANASIFGSSITNAIADSIMIGPSDASKITITTTGLGIATTTPGYALTVAGDISLTGALRANGNAGTAGMVLLSNGSSAPTWVATSSLGISGGGSLSGGTNGYLARWTSDSALSTGLLLDNGTVAGVNATSSSYTFNVQGSSGVHAFNVASSTGTSMFNVLASGNIGVGTTTPGYGFVIVGNSDTNAKGPLYIASTNANTYGTGFNMDATAAGGRNYSITAGGSSAYNPNGWAIYDSTQGAYRLSVNASGYTTVGTITSPSGSSASQLGVRGNTSIGSTYFGVAAPTDGLIVEGNVGIGTTTPSAKFAVQGSGLFAGDLSAANITATGTISLANTTSSSIGVINMNGSRFIHGYTSSSFFAGTGAGNFTTTGSSNTGIGAATLDALTSGWGNVAIGHASLGAKTTGVRNTAIGYAAQDGSTGGNDNVSVGYITMRSVSGTDNSAFGNSALSALTSGSRNIGIGSAAGANLLTGTDNIIIGDNISAITTSISNSLNIGNLIFGTSLDGTGTTLSTGNIGIGTTTPSSKLTVFGTTTSNAFNVNTLGSSLPYGDIMTVDSTRFLRMATTSSVGVTFLGYGAGKSTSITGNLNTGFGYQVMNGGGGNRNTMMGYQAFYRSGDSSSASDNTVIGSSALSGNFAGAGVVPSANTIIGSSAGSGLTSGASNVFIGLSAGANLTSGSGNISIGTNAYVPSTTGSNQLNIGNLIYGTGVDGSGTTLSTGNIGIGTTTPGAKLHALSTTEQLRLGYDASNYTPFTVGSTGNVSIAPKGSGAGLTISNTQTISNSLLVVSSAYNTGNSLVDISYSGSDGGRGLSITDASFNTGTALITKSTGPYPTNANVSGLLINATYTHSDAGAAGTIGNGARIVASNNTASAGTLYGLDISSTANTSGATAVGLRVTSASSAGTNYAAIFSGGNVGIGTTTPAFPLDVYSTVSSTQTYGYLNSAGAVGTAGPGASDYSIRAQGRILAQEFNAVSDARLKDVQFDLSSNVALDAITKLQPVSFTWKKNPTGQPILGFLAQDVELAIPNAVSKIATENFVDQREVSYNQITAVLVGAVKEIKNQLDMLKDKVTAIAGWFSGDGDRFNVKGMVCVDEVCVTKDQFKQMLINSGSVMVIPSEPASGSIENDTNANQDSGEITNQSNTTSTGGASSSVDTTEIDETPGENTIVEEVSTPIENPVPPSSPEPTPAPDSTPEPVE